MPTRPAKPKAGRKHRIEQSQVVHKIVFDERPTVEISKFQDAIVTLYGPPKIGKSTLGSLIPGVYFLPTEPGVGSLPVRNTPIPNWVTFREFVKTMEQSPQHVQVVSMWAIDVIDALSQMCVENIYFEWQINEMTDEDWGRAYTELRQEFMYWLLRLKALGPGLLMISHERQREFKSRAVRLNKDSMDLPKTTYNVVSNNSDIIMHMRYDQESRNMKDIGRLRCLSFRGSESEDAGDRTKRLPAVIRFKDEQEAVKGILACFGKPGPGGGSSKPPVKKRPPTRRERR